MKKIENVKTIDRDYIKSAFDIKPDDFFFDIETTGLSKKLCHIYMIGIGKIDGDQIIVTQFLAETIKEERIVIKAFLDSLPEYSRLITYNGEGFDIPFVSEKSDEFKSKFEAGFIKSYDIYKEVKPLKHLLRLPALKQKNIESFLGIKRDDKYDGGKLIKVYEEYEKRGDSDLEDLLLLHNKEDVEGMPEIIPVLIYKRLFKKSINVTGFEKSGNQLLLQGKIDFKLPAPIRIINDDFYLILEKDTLKGSINLYDGRMKHYFPDYKDYVYLLEDRKIIPKKMSGGIDPSRYRKASREDCFVYVDVDNINNEFLTDTLNSLINSI